MSLDSARQILAVQQQLESLRKADRPAIRLPYAQRTVNPFPLASSGGATGDFPQSSALTLAAFNVSVLVQTTNSAAQFWTVRLLDSAGSTLATFTTAAIGPATPTRFSTTITAQPAASSAYMSITATATLAPGAIFIIPEVLVLL